MWDTENAAQGCIQQELEDSQHLEGRDLGPGIIVTPALEFAPPNLGSDSAGLRLLGLISQLESESTTIIFWRRGPGVATVGFLALDDENRYQQLIRLAESMYERVDGVLAGEIRATVAIIPTPVTQATPSTPDLELIEGFDLPAMVPDLNDLPDGTDFASEGSIPDSDALASCERLFRSAGDSVLRGTSEVTEIRATVGVYTTPNVARVPIDFIASQGVALFQEGFAASPEAGANVVAESLEFPQIGGVSTAVSLTFESLLGELQGYLVYFSRGQVRTPLFVLDRPGTLAVADIQSLAELIGQRIQANSP